MQHAAQTHMERRARVYHPSALYVYRVAHSVRRCRSDVGGPRAWPAHRSYNSILTPAYAQSAHMLPHAHAAADRRRRPYPIRGLAISIN